ncbi:MAG: type II toxin-antitoxin system VapC family toxin [Acidobacteria bacterium]|nr:type II toxin-antitoxin system VapC family toxin [Acidobacteriota bacterium]MBS1864791.1 type II toxin-antitoxin system VapC family toxin [Acidobacteriota bacterium]
MVLLDTNVISALMHPQPEPVVLDWLNRQPSGSIWTTSITLIELRYGLQIMPAGARRDRMAAALEVVLNKELEGRLAVFDLGAAEHTASLMAARRVRGRQMDFRDTLIAGIALANRATLATRNISHFSDLSTPVVNPWTD